MGALVDDAGTFLLCLQLTTELLESILWKMLTKHCLKALLGSTPMMPEYTYEEHGYFYADASAKIEVQFLVADTSELWVYAL